MSVITTIKKLLFGAARKGKDERDPCNPCYRYAKGSLIISFLSCITLNKILCKNIEAMLPCWYHVDC